jgi:hypothetical protein
MPQRTVPILSEYERKRQEQIAKNKALFQDLNLTAAASGIAPRRPAPKHTPAKRVTRKSDANDGKENQEPSRRSLRIRNIQPDNVAAKRQAEEDLERRAEEERAKKRRRSGDLNVNDLITSGESWDSTGNFLRGVAPPRPYERSFDLETAKETSDKAVRDAVDRMSGLTLWQDVEPNSMSTIFADSSYFLTLKGMKVTPERVVRLVSWNRLSYIYLCLKISTLWCSTPQPIKHSFLLEISLEA